MQEEQASKENSDAQLQGRWTPQEHQRFICALLEHGKNWKLIQTTVESRTTSQVRSHAQKFFLKMLKIEKERKKNLKKGVTNPSRTELDLLEALQQHPLTAHTPQEVLHFLRKEPKPRPAPPSPHKDSAAERQHTHGQITLRQVLGLCEQESFLASLMHNIAFFDRDEAFTDLIDLPDHHHQKEEDEETSNKRKKSFSLYEDEEDQDKYDQTIRRMNGR